MTSILIPAVPAGTYDDFRPGALTRGPGARQWTPADRPLPALCLSHGAPARSVTVTRAAHGTGIGCAGVRRCRAMHQPVQRTWPGSAGL
jgi:hypothetical protein